MVEAEVISDLYMGIDLGTCNSAVGYWKSDTGTYEMVQNVDDNL